MAIIHEIDVSGIINSCEDMLELSDIVHLLSEVDDWNLELDIMMCSDAPESETYEMCCKLAFDNKFVMDVTTDEEAG